MNSIATNNIHVARETKCSLCAGIGHNIRSCQQMPFRLEQAHKEYLYMWLSWFEQINAQLVNVTDYFRYAKIITIGKRNWLKNPMNIRLLKTFLKITHIKGVHQIRNYIDGLYHYLVLKKNGILHHVIQNSLPILANLATLATTNYAHYDYLLETIPYTRVFNATKQYGILINITHAEINAIAEEECPICYDQLPSSNFVKTICEHSFCLTCITNTIQILPHNKKLSCAMCRSTITNLSCYTFESYTNLKTILNL